MQRNAPSRGVPPSNTVSRGLVEAGDECARCRGPYLCIAFSVDQEMLSTGVAGV